MDLIVDVQMHEYILQPGSGSGSGARVTSISTGSGVRARTSRMLLDSGMATGAAAIESVKQETIRAKKILHCMTMDNEVLVKGPMCGRDSVLGEDNREI